MLHNLLKWTTFWSFAGVVSNAADLNSAQVKGGGRYDGITWDHQNLWTDKIISG